jgi:hypothetical protein
VEAAYDVAIWHDEIHYKDLHRVEYVWSLAHDMHHSAGGKLFLSKGATNAVLSFHFPSAELSYAGFACLDRV